MKWFSREEFVRPDPYGNGKIDWYPKMDPRLLEIMDDFREKWGTYVIISPSPWAIGRMSNTSSQHSYTRHGKVKAVDLMPFGIEERGLKEAYDIALTTDAGGIGLYPDWRPRPGIHLDSRERGSRPAQWGGVTNNGKREYVSVEQVW